MIDNSAISLKTDQDIKFEGVFCTKINDEIFILWASFLGSSNMPGRGKHFF